MLSIQRQVKIHGWSPGSCALVCLGAALVPGGVLEFFAVHAQTKSTSLAALILCAAVALGVALIAAPTLLARSPDRMKE